MFYGNTHLHKFTSASGIVPLQLPKDASHPSGKEDFTNTAQWMEGI